MFRTAAALVCILFSTAAVADEVIVGPAAPLPAAGPLPPPPVAAAPVAAVAPPMAAPQPVGEVQQSVQPAFARVRLEVGVTSMRAGGDMSNDDDVAYLTGGHGLQLALGYRFSEQLSMHFMFRGMSLGLDGPGADYVTGTEADLAVSLRLMIPCAPNFGLGFELGAQRSAMIFEPEGGDSVTISGNGVTARGFLDIGFSQNFGLVAGLTVSRMDMEGNTVGWAGVDVNLALAF